MKSRLASILLLSLTSACAGGCGTHAITRADVVAAQEAWGEGIVAIGKAKDKKAAGRAHIDRFYAYDLGTVLFKPTKAAEHPFRGTKEEALSYFVGGAVKEDLGFALAPYRKVRFENRDIIIGCDSALAMGHYYFTRQDGGEVKVEYSFAYVADAKGALKINLQHSSMPYAPAH